METETIVLTIMSEKLRHYKASEIKVIEIDKKVFFTQALKYINEYVTKNKFKIINATSEQNRMIYFLVKE